VRVRKRLHRRILRRPQVCNCPKDIYSKQSLKGRQSVHLFGIVVRVCVDGFTGVSCDDRRSNLELIRQSRPDCGLCLSQLRVECFKRLRALNTNPPRNYCPQGLCRTGGEKIHGFKDDRADNGSVKGHNLALTALCVSSSLDSGALLFVPLPRGIWSLGHLMKAV
jgi:hypothetical protein